MSTMYCNLCKRPVEAKREIGVGSFILVLLTGGAWLIALFFYRQRCCICKSTVLSNTEGVEPEMASSRNRTLVLFLVFICLTSLLKIIHSSSSSEKNSHPVVEITKKTDIPEVTNKIEIKSSTVNKIDYDMIVCNAYKNKEDKQRCINDIRTSESEKNTPKHEYNSESPVFHAASDEEIEKVFDVIQMAFIGNNSKTLIKLRLDEAMVLYNTPITISNYNSCASVLVAMRKQNGVSEMAILKYMIEMHSSKNLLGFGPAAAFAAVLMTSN